MKETSMNSRFSKRFEQGLTQIKESLYKKSGVKKQQKVWERIGKLKAKYPGTNKYYDIKVNTNDNGIVTNVSWEQKAVQIQRATTCYALPPLTKTKNKPNGPFTTPSVK